MKCFVQFCCMFFTHWYTWTLLHSLSSSSRQYPRLHLPLDVSLLLHYIFSGFNHSWPSMRSVLDWKLFSIHLEWFYNLLTISSPNCFPSSRWVSDSPIVSQVFKTQQWYTVYFINTVTYINFDLNIFTYLTFLWHICEFVAWSWYPIRSIYHFLIIFRQFSCMFDLFFS